MPSLSRSFPAAPWISMPSRPPASTPRPGPSQRSRSSSRTGPFGIAWNQLSEGALWAAIFFGPLALGCYRGWPLQGLLALALAALLAAALSTRALPVTGLGLTLVGVSAFVGIQLIPLPAGLLAALSPGAAESYRFALQGLPGAALLHPLTLDAPATLQELCKLLAYAAAFLATYALAGSRRAARRLTLALALIGLAEALLGYLHKLLGFENLLGLPIFKEAGAPFVTTFGNRNNAAGLLVLCAPLALALSLREKAGRRRILWLLAYLLTGAAVFLTLSRGGIFAFLSGQAALGLLLWTQRPLKLLPGVAEAAMDRRRRARRTLAIVLCGVAGAISIAGYLAYEPILGRLATLSSREDLEREGKLEGFRLSLGVLRDFPATGVGRGAFPTAGARYMTFAPGTAEFIENEPLQALADLGLPVGVALLLAILWAGAAPLRREELSPLECGLWAGLFSLGLQSLFDFSLELGGIALPAAVALALLARSTADPERPTLALPRSTLLGGLSLAAIVGLWAAGAHGHGWHAETDRFATEAPSLSVEAALRAARPILERHPASFVIPLALADRLLVAREPSRALGFLGRAMFLKPNVAAPHLAAAEALAELGHKPQALLEARLYFETSGGDGRALRELAARFPTVADLERAVPTTPEGQLALVDFLRSIGRAKEAIAIARSVETIDPGSAALHAKLAALLLETGALADAVAEDRLRLTLSPDEPSSYLDLSAALSAKGDHAAAARALDDGLRRLPGEVNLVLARARLELQAGHPEAASAELARVGPLTGGGERAQILTLQGEIYEREGRSAKAEDAYRGAARIDPTGGHEWAIAALLERQSRFTEAARLLGRLRALAAPDQQPSIARRIAEDERRAQDLEDAARSSRILGNSRAAGPSAVEGGDEGGEIPGQSALP